MHDDDDSHEYEAEQRSEDVGAGEFHQNRMERVISGGMVVKAGGRVAAAFLSDWAEMSGHTAMQASYHLNGIMAQFGWDDHPDREGRLDLLTTFLTGFVEA